MLSREDAAAIAELRASLPDGDFRFAPSAAHLSLSWFPHQQVGLEETLFSDFAATDPEEEEHVEALRQEWTNELRIVTQLLERRDEQDASASKETTARERMWSGLNRRARALAAWDAYAVPVRLRGQRVFRIWSPRDALGLPIIKGVSLKGFLVGVCQHTAAQSSAIALSQHQVRWWRGAALVLGATAAALAVALLR